VPGRPRCSPAGCRSPGGQYRAPRWRPPRATARGWRRGPGCNAREPCRRLSGRSEKGHGLTARSRYVFLYRRRTGAVTSAGEDLRHGTHWQRKAGSQSCKDMKT
jgi:hypothetical protein